MNIKIISHIMPWEIDYALLMFTQLKKTRYHLNPNDKFTVEVELNLTSYLYDWDKSELPKKFFIDKFNTLLILLKDYDVNSSIYEGDELHGHLDLQKKSYSKETDFYISLCPDTYFSESVIPYMVEGAKTVKNRYFVITPQVSKVGDSDWDIIVDERYMNIPYSEYLNVDTFDIIYNNELGNSGEKLLEPMHRSKFAGWCDLYSKEMFETLCPVQTSWRGYGPWDYYSMIVTNYCKSAGVDYQQYLLRGETIWMYESGPLKESGFSGYYRRFLKTKNVMDQRKEFEKNLEEYVKKTLIELNNKGIL